MARLNRRQVLGLIAFLPAGALLAACGGDANGAAKDTPSATRTLSTEVPPIAATPAPTATRPPAPSPTSTPEPFVLPAGESSDRLMPDTPYETPYYSFASGTQGPIVLVLGGVHGNEPGGWLAADRLVEQVRPAKGALLIVPRANRQAIDLFERTTDELGDLNRLYPGDPNGLPMARMAYEIVDVIHSFHVTHVIDMHESWAFYRDRTATATGTAYLGQTVSSRGEPGESLGMTMVDKVNTAWIQSPIEEFTFRVWPPQAFVPDAAPGATPVATPADGFTGYRGRHSSLSLPDYVPGLAAILVEMGQQQELERRIQLHVAMVQEALNTLGA